MCIDLSLVVARRLSVSFPLFTRYDTIPFDDDISSYSLLFACFTRLESRNFSVVLYIDDNMENLEFSFVLSKTELLLIIKRRW